MARCLCPLTADRRSAYSVPVPYLFGDELPVSMGVQMGPVCYCTVDPFPAEAAPQRAQPATRSACMDRRASLPQIRRRGHRRLGKQPTDLFPHGAVEDRDHEGQLTVDVRDCQCVPQRDHVLPHRDRYRDGPPTDCGS